MIWRILVFLEVAPLLLAAQTSELRFYRCTTSFVSEQDSDPFADPDAEKETPKVPSVIPQFSDVCYDIRKPFRDAGIDTELALHFEDIELLAVRASGEAQELIAQYISPTRHRWLRILDVTTRSEQSGKETALAFGTIPTRSGQRVSHTTAGGEGLTTLEFDPSLHSSGKYCLLNLAVETSIGKAVYKLSTATTLALGVPHTTILGLRPDGSGDTITLTLNVDVRRVPPPPILDGDNKELVKKALAAKLTKTK